MTYEEMLSRAHYKIIEVTFPERRVEDPLLTALEALEGNAQSVVRLTDVMIAKHPLRFQGVLRRIRNMCDAELNYIENSISTEH